MKKYLQIDKNDNVAVALHDMSKGEVFEYEGNEYTLCEDISCGHKFALKNINTGENVMKYGFAIGHATEDILLGTWVHTHNVKTNLEGLLEYKYEPVEVPAIEKMDATFDGFVRENGEVGIRNEIWIINTVGCVNKTAELLAKKAQELSNISKVDGVYCYTHPYGCSQLGDDHLNTQKILAGLIRHPNAGGVLVLSLGCENNNLDNFKPVLGEYDENRVKFLVTQNVEDEIEEGLKLISELIDYAGGFKRVPVPASKLKIGLKCGGSDGFSGITANPLLGKFSDMLCACGGITVLSEVPEMFGAETILMNRAENEDIFERIVSMINNFKLYFTRYEQNIYENPSPGNKKGGITTLEDKSLGCTQKGGLGAVVDVLNYGETAQKPGLNLLTGPGNDIVACTALAASGVHAILFTTGRGTPLGAPVPTVKVATNTALATKKSNWIDFNAGQLVDGVSMEAMSKEFFEYVLDLASGKALAKNEINGYKEISIFKDGVTL
ncbi:MAG: altronate dehydratase [Clostridiales bacterium]|nr:altronate dehydratase [Clostridiales bacterium]